MFYCRIERSQLATQTEKKRANTESHVGLLRRLHKYIHLCYGAFHLLSFTAPTVVDLADEEILVCICIKLW